MCTHTCVYPYMCVPGWCTYYTCLKRLSTFFTVVAAQSDYCVWMTGSPPSSVRFNLLNAGPDDTVRLCMWFKTTQRKDVYKVSVWTCMWQSACLQHMCTYMHAFLHVRKHPIHMYALSACECFDVPYLCVHVIYAFVVETEVTSYIFVYLIFIGFLRMVRILRPRT